MWLCEDLTLKCQRKQQILEKHPVDVCVDQEFEIPRKRDLISDRHKILGFKVNQEKEKSVTSVACARSQPSFVRTNAGRPSGTGS